MAAGTSLSSLISRKSEVNQNIADLSNKVADLEDKIERLQQASNSLETSLESVRQIKKDVDDFEVSAAKWKGVEEKSFISKHNSYAIYLNKYDSDASEAKDQIDKDLKVAKTEKTSATIGLTAQNGILNLLEFDIQLAKEDS